MHVHINEAREDNYASTGHAIHIHVELQQSTNLCIKHIGVNKEDKRSFFSAKRGRIGENLEQGVHKEPGRLDVGDERDVILNCHPPRLVAAIMLKH